VLCLVLVVVVQRDVWWLMRCALFGASTIGPARLAAYVAAYVASTALP
jgi:hypothetical protein